MTMSDFARAALVALALALNFPTVAMAADTNDTAAPTQAAKLPIDGEVRHGMLEIHQLVTEALPSIKSGALDPSGYSHLADGIAAHVEQLAANSRLPADLKTRLKAELLPLVTAAQSLKTKGEMAATAIVSSLDHYGQVFDHPGWSTPKGE